MTNSQRERLLLTADSLSRSTNTLDRDASAALRSILARQPAAIDKQCTCKGVLGHSRQCAMFDESMMSMSIGAPLDKESGKPAAPVGWRFNVGSSDDRIWLTVTTPHGATASLSCADRNGSGRTIQGQVLMALKEALDAPAAPSVEQDESGAFEAWAKKQGYRFNEGDLRNAKSWALAAWMARAAAQQAEPSTGICFFCGEPINGEHESDCPQAAHAASTSANVAQGSLTDEQKSAVTQAADVMGANGFHWVEETLRQIVSANVAQGAKP